MDIFEPMYVTPGDLDFIKLNYLDLYELLKPDITADRLHVTIHSDKQWDKIQDLFVDYIGGSLNEAGELNENGLRLEHILDFA